MEAVVVGGGILYIIAYAPVDKRMAGIVANIVPQITAKISQSPLSLLLGFDLCHVIQAAAEKQVNVVLVHIGAYISIIPVAQNRNIIEKHIRSLKPKLVEPAVFGNNKLTTICLPDS